MHVERTQTRERVTGCRTLHTTQGKRQRRARRENEARRGGGSAGEADEVGRGKVGTIDNPINSPTRLIMLLK